MRIGNSCRNATSVGAVLTGEVSTAMAVANAEPQGGEASAPASVVGPLVTFIVPVRNEATTIEHCVRTLLEQDLGPARLEVVVAEGRSDDGTRAILDRIASDDPRIRVVDNPSGRTPDAFNRAIWASSGTYVGAVSGHSSVAPDYAARCLQVARETEAWCVGGRMEQESSTPFGRAVAAAAGSRFGVGDSAFHYARERRQVDTVFPGFWPRWVFERVGMFDPELLRNQDDELSYRIRAAGGTIWFDPGIKVTYRPRETWRRLFDQYRQYGKYKVRVFQKHPQAARWRHLVPGAFVGAMLTAPLAIAIPWLAFAVAGTGAGYAAVNAGASAVVSRRTNARFIDVSRSFLGMHLGYGIGFWQGLIAYAPRWFKGRSGPVVPRLPTGR